MKGSFKNIKIHFHKGRRQYQEDSYAIGEHFLLVADGVGGLATGNIASCIVANTWRNAFIDRIFEISTLQENIEFIIQKTIDQLLDYSSKHCESSGMGSTLATLAWINEQLVSIHIGDSRVYHFDMKGNLKWRSKDHSLVQELIDGNVISKEQAITHPQRNIITRVIQAKNDFKTYADINILKDVKDGDIVLLCSDGINESWTDAELSFVFMTQFDPEKSIKIIGNQSAENSKDNNTAILAEINLISNHSEDIV
jgi:serine/threonine protein phosphatase PrpC